MTDDSNNAHQKGQAYHSHYAVDVNGSFQFDGGRLASLKAKLQTEPRILSKKAGRDSCSIFRVPKNFIEVNGEQYHPHIVSIGPFHHHYRKRKRKQKDLEIMQEHKHHYLFQLLCRTQVTLEYLFENIAALENSARECYSEEIELDSHDFVEIMVVDGCFIIELLRKIGKFPVMFEHDDPIATMSWIMPILIRDLLRLENQVPFFVLQKLFDLTTSTSSSSPGPSLWDLCFEFFGYEKAVYRPPSVVERMRGYQARHLLDLLRSSFIPPEMETVNRDLTGPNIPSHVIHCVSKLRKAGIMIRPPPRKGRDQETETFLAVNFKRWGVLHMPMVTIDDFMTSFFANCVAYEHCQKNCTTYFITYTTLLDCLVNTGKDVGYLCDENIIENYYGTESEVAKFLNNLGKDTAFDVDRCYLGEVFNQVNRYYENDWHVQWASFKYTYFNTPWSFISAFAAFILLVLSIFQTIYTILSYQKQQKP